MKTGFLKKTVVVSSLVFGAAFGAWVEPAHAFSDPALFAAPASVGGGAGRYFTGSPGDGHSCGVCHGGAPAPTVDLSGFPDFPESGKRYEVFVSWERPEISHALHLEIVGESGQHPSVALEGLDNLPVESRCDGEASGEAAVYTFDVGTRRVLGVQDCGAKAFRFSFVAPSEPFSLALGVVASNSSATADGDGVFELRRVFPPPESSCAFSPTREDGTIPSVILFWGLLQLLHLRRGGQFVRSQQGRRAA